MLTGEAGNTYSEVADIARLPDSVADAMTQP
jgi:hypothetical protein